LFGRFIEAGATHLILNLGNPRQYREEQSRYPSGIIRRLAAEVVEPLLSNS
jgi:hypothetical protein